MGLRQPNRGAQPSEAAHANRREPGVRTRVRGRRRQDSPVLRTRRHHRTWGFDSAVLRRAQREGRPHGARAARSLPGDESLHRSLARAYHHLPPHRGWRKRDARLRFANDRRKVVPQSAVRAYATSMPLWLSESEVQHALAMGELIDAMQTALISFSSGEAIQPVRTAFEFGPRAFFAAMPACDPGSGLIGAKLVSVLMDNAAKDLPSHQALIA